MKSFALLINAANGILTDSISNFEIEYITQNEVDIQDGDVIIGTVILSNPLTEHASTAVITNPNSNAFNNTKLELQ